MYTWNVTCLSPKVYANQCFFCGAIKAMASQGAQIGVDFCVSCVAQNCGITETFKCSYICMTTLKIKRLQVHNILVPSFFTI